MITIVQNGWEIGFISRKTNNGYDCFIFCNLFCYIMDYEVKIFYLNDTLFDQNVWINDLHEKPLLLKSRSGRVFDVKDRLDTIPFIKVWQGDKVLISLMDFKEEKSD